MKERAEDLIFLDMTENPVQFSEVTGLDIPTIARIWEHYILEVQYTHLTVTLPVKYVAKCLVFIDGLLYDGLTTCFTAEEDFLELFENKDRKEDNHDYKASLKEFFDMSTESVIDWIKENEEEVWEGIKESIISNIDSDELDEGMKENIADSWIEDNPNGAVEKAEDYLCCDDMKDIIIHWLHNNF